MTPLAWLLGGRTEQRCEGDLGVLGDDQPFLFRAALLGLFSGLFGLSFRHDPADAKIVISSEKSAPAGTRTRTAADTATRVQTAHVCLFRHWGEKNSLGATTGRPPTPSPSSPWFGPPSTAHTLTAQEPGQ